MTFPTQAHIDAAQTAADRVWQSHGVYIWPSATLAQADIESAGWTRPSGKNNGFGIKATEAQRAAGKATLRRTREVIKEQDVYIDAWFADYDSLADAYEAHAMLFVRVGLYAEALKATNSVNFVRAMARHYATAPDYATVIINAMTWGHLYRYDKPVSERGKPAGGNVVPPPPDVPMPRPDLPPPTKPAPVSLWRRILAWLLP